MTIQGNPADLSRSAMQFSGLAGAMGSTQAGVGASFDSLAGWQGAGADQAFAAGQAAQSHLDKARASLTAAHQALVTYQSEVEQAQMGWTRAETEENQYKAELAAARAQLAAATANLAHIQAENAAAEQAYANATTTAELTPSASLTSSPFVSVPPPTLLSTIAAQATITQLHSKIQQLEQEIQTREKWKTEYEARAKQASAKVSSELSSAEQLWPAAGYGNWKTDGWTSKACLVGYNPPAPSHDGGILPFLVVGGTVILTAPLDEVGAGEAIDAEVAAAEFGAEGAANAGAQGAANSGLSGRVVQTVADAAPAFGRNLAAHAAEGAVGGAGWDLVLHQRVKLSDLTSGAAAGVVAGLVPGAAPIRWGIGGTASSAGQQYLQKGTVNPVSAGLQGLGWAVTDDAVLSAGTHHVGSFFIEHRPTVIPGFDPPKLP